MSRTTRALAGATARVAHRTSLGPRRSPRRSQEATTFAPSASGEARAAQRQAGFGPNLARPIAWGMTPARRGRATAPRRAARSPPRPRPGTPPRTGRGAPPPPRRAREARPGPGTEHQPDHARVVLQRLQQAPGAERAKRPGGECCLAHCLTTSFPDYFARRTGRFPGLRSRFDGVLAGCRTAVGASSRFAAPALRCGPSGDPLPCARPSASMAIGGAFGHGPIARRIVGAGA